MQQPNKLMPFYENIAFDRISDNTMVINFGPQHPSAHGQLRLILELEGTDIKIDYIIDKSRRRDSLKYNVLNLEDKWQQVDGVIVTIVDEFDSIYQFLKKRIDCRIFSLYEILSELP